MGHLVRPKHQGEYLPPVAVPGPRPHHQEPPARFRTLDVWYSGWHDWQAMREALRKAREISPATAAPRLPSSSASIIPEPCRAPSVGSDKLTPVSQVREGYGQEVSGHGRCAIDTVSEKGRSMASHAQLSADSSSIPSILIWAMRASSAALSKSVFLSDPSSSSCFK